MPFPNRVDPWGRLHAVAARGTFLGNRGILHNRNKEIVAQWKTKAWITCRLVWKGRRRAIMTPGSYTELFFLDEATAFSAGHRPCAECRRERFREFKTRWIAANSEMVIAPEPSAALIDKMLHSQRVRKGGMKVTYEAELGTLPDGTMIEHGGAAYLIWEKRLWQWSFAGYVERKESSSPQRRVRVLTPASLVNMFRAGFRPQVHDSVQEVIAGEGAS
jgi:hypothetical protein